jgi:alpha-mannosidase
MTWFYSEEKVQVLLRAVGRGTIKERSPLSPIKYAIGDFGSKAAKPDFDDSSWETLPSSNDWGSQSEITAWLRAKVQIPASWKGDKAVLHVLPRDCEILAYVDGRRVQAFDGAHHELVVSDKIGGESTHVIALDAYSGLPSTGEANAYFNTEPSKTHRLGEAELWRVEPETFEYYYDLKFLLDTYRVSDKETREAVALLNALTESVNTLDLRQGEQSQSFYDSVRKARAILTDQVLSKKANEFAPTLWAAGHAHIDTAWLWRLDHTRNKCARTFSTAIEMIKRYPDYKFSCSQPQQYAYIKQDHPELFEDIKKAVKAGRWETVGGMWIEADCNVTSGESLVRQLLYGQRFFKEEFGSRSDVVWLPDVFGYSAAFPQIIKKAGMKYFMTIKIFWSQINKPTYQTFRWFGIDGTDVLTHFSPLGDYNAVMSPQQLRKTWQDYNQKNLNDSALYIYGYGDGGGGPTYQMLEAAKRSKDTFVSPKVKQSTAQEFFEDLDKQVSGKPDLPVWNGELYLELHRGTYTTQSKNKAFNRQSEILYQTAEQLAVLSQAAGQPYPTAKIKKGWQLLLLNQFHDIIPGSSIHEVYQDSDRDYAAIFEIGNSVAESSLTAIATKVSADPGSVLVYNPLSWSRKDVGFVPAELAAAGQDVTDIRGVKGTLVSFPENLPTLGVAALSQVTPAAAKDLTVTTTRLENKFFSILLDKNAEISSISDKRNGREVIDNQSYCKGNSLIAFEDRPMNWQAWDIDIYYQDKPYPIIELDSVSIIEEGPIRAGVEVKRTMTGGKGSTIRQRIFIYADLDRIDFETEVDWKESCTLLKAAFPVTVNALRASFDIQFGSIDRPTHWNTSWDWARFEVCGQKWADLSEGDYGVSVLSDSKYGWDVRDNVIRLTLLRAPNHPDPTADIGIHHFTYSLYPHAGDWRAGETVQRAYELNVPPKFVAAKSTVNSSLPKSLSLLAVDAPNLVVETVKKAEDDDSIVVRLYEAYNQRGTTTITFASHVSSAKAVNLMEDEPDGDDPTIHGAQIKFAYKPYEIKTFKVKLKN